MMVWRRCR